MSKRMFDPNYTTETEVYFYTPRFYALDNFTAFVVAIWGKTFPTSEHAYQWKKYASQRPDLAEMVEHATSAHAAKKIADAHKDDLTATWHQDKLAIMEEILRAKLDQHEKIRRLLIETENKTIIENSPTDYYWGIGSDGTGENQLGKLWMKLRDELKENSNI